MGRVAADPAGPAYPRPGWAGCQHPAGPESLHPAGPDLPAPGWAGFFRTRLGQAGTLAARVGQHLAYPAGPGVQACSYRCLARDDSIDPRQINRSIRVSCRSIAPSQLRNLPAESSTGRHGTRDSPAESAAGRRPGPHSRIMCQVGSSPASPSQASIPGCSKSSILRRRI